MSKCLRTKDGRIIDLDSKAISSWEYIPKDIATGGSWGLEDAFYNIFYYNRDCGEHCETDGKGGRSMDTIFDYEILKTGDSVEALCDEFVVLRDSKVQKQFRKSTMLKDSGWRRVYPLACCEWLGAVWTSQGLIFVAKMNNEGDMISL